MNSGTLSYILKRKNCSAGPKETAPKRPKAQGWGEREGFMRG